jgi:hypothetical protein
VVVVGAGLLVTLAITEWLGSASLHGERKDSLKYLQNIDKKIIN